jgi:hypothetical protein
VARIRLDPRKSVRSFKGIICGDISEFESHMLSQAVGLHSSMCRGARSPASLAAARAPRAATLAGSPEKREHSPQFGGHPGLINALRVAHPLFGEFEKLLALIDLLR